MKQKTYYHIILDQSGSMRDCLYPTISGFNEQLQLVRSLKLRYPDQEIYFGLTRFNNEVMHTYFAEDPAIVKELTPKIYLPDGTTALYDAIGSTVTNLQTNLSEEVRSNVATVVIVVLTDGHENASTKYSFHQISSLIKELEVTGKWTFSYLGATPDAVDIAVKLNFKQHNAMAFDKTQMSKTYDRLGKSMSGYMDRRASQKDLDKFLDDDK